jgi:hypothetical protein
MQRGMRGGISSVEACILDIGFSILDFGLKLKQNQPGCCKQPG